jgi:hypothetical protein
MSVPRLGHGIAQGNGPAIAEREHGIGAIVTLAIPMGVDPQHADAHHHSILGLMHARGSLGELLGHDLATKGEAVRALADAGEPPRVSLPPELAHWGHAGGDDHPSDVASALATEVAPRLGVLFRSKRGPTVRPLFAFGEHLVREREAPLADEHARPRDELAYLPLGGPAEAARPVGLAFSDRALAGSRVHDLMDPLVTEPERVGDLSKRCTGPMESPDSVLRTHLSLISLVLEVDGTISLVARLPEELWIEGHVSTMVDVVRKSKRTLAAHRDASANAARSALDSVATALR